MSAGFYINASTYISNESNVPIWVCIYLHIYVRVFIGVLVFMHTLNEVQKPSVRMASQAEPRHCSDETTRGLDCF